MWFGLPFRRFVSIQTFHFEEELQEEVSRSIGIVEETCWIGLSRASGSSDWLWEDGKNLGRHGKWSSFQNFDGWEGSEKEEWEPEDYVFIIPYLLNNQSQNTGLPDGRSAEGAVAHHCKS